MKTLRACDKVLQTKVQRRERTMCGSADEGVAHSGCGNKDGVTIELDPKLLAWHTLVESECKKVIPERRSAMVLGKEYEVSGNEEVE